MAKIKYGLSHAYIAKRIVSPEGAVSYGAPVALPGLVSFSVDKEQTEVSFYADDTLYFHSQAKTSEGGDLELADIPRAILLDYLGYKNATEGGILETNDLALDHCALMFQVQTDAQARKFIYYNCALAESSEEFNTIGEDVSPQTSTMTVTASGETVGDYQVFKRVLESTDEGYETAFTSVVIPTIAA